MMNHNTDRRHYPILQVLLLLTLLLLCAGCANQNSQSAAAFSSTASVASAAAESVDTVPETLFTETDSFPFPFPGKLDMTQTAPRELILTREEALYDYDTMWQLLRENYPFFTAIREGTEIDPDEVQVRYRAKLEESCASGKIEGSELIDLFNDCLSEFQHIGHLFLCNPGIRDLFIRRFDGEQGKYGNLAAIVDNERSQRFYTVYKDQLSCLNRPATEETKEDVSENDRPQEVVADDYPLLLGYANGIPYVGLWSMDYESWTEEHRAELSAFLTENKDAPHLILDIRGNGGGATDTWMSVVALLLAQPASAESLLGFQRGALNLWIDEAFQNPNDCFDQVYTDDSWAEELSGTPDPAMYEMDTIVKMIHSVHPAEDSVQFGGKIWLLVDEGVYSASEELAIFSKQTGFATLVGTTTGGNGTGRNPHIIALPWSGLLVYYAPEIGLNSDGTCNDIIGTAPDYPVDNSANALEECLMLINR